MDEEIIAQQQGNKYDRIMKENTHALLPVLIKDVLYLDISHREEIPSDIQYTKERIADKVNKVIDSDNNAYVLHLEWQFQNETDMVYRMAEYAIMLYRKFRLPVKQFVVFMGQDGIKMTTEINKENLRYSFEIVELRKTDYKKFLHSEDPAIQVFAILANFEKDDVDKALKDIYKTVRMSDSKGLTGDKYYTQLCMLLQLHNDNINQKFKNMMSVFDFYDPEKDVRYVLGIEKGIEKIKNKMPSILKSRGMEEEEINQILNDLTKDIELDQ
jgi:hypothetical protein